MTHDQLATHDRKKSGVVAAARQFIREHVKQKPTKSLRLARARLEVAVIELEAFEQECGLTS